MPYPRRLDDELAVEVRESLAQRKVLTQRVAEAKAQWLALKGELSSFPSLRQWAVKLGMSRRAVFEIGKGMSYKRVAHADGNEEG